jgi:hypothetical protein
VKIPILPFSLALEKWRWGVMAGQIKPNQYNQAWWNLKLKYQGRRVKNISSITRMLNSVKYIYVSANNRNSSSDRALRKRF